MKTFGICVLLAFAFVTGFSVSQIFFPVRVYVEAVHSQTSIVPEQQSAGQQALQALEQDMAHEQSELEQGEEDEDSMQYGLLNKVVEVNVLARTPSGRSWKHIFLAGTQVVYRANEFRVINGTATRLVRVVGTDAADLGDILIPAQAITELLPIEPLPSQQPTLGQYSLDSDRWQ